VVVKYSDVVICRKLYTPWDLIQGCDMEGQGRTGYKRCTYRVGSYYMN